MNSALWVQVTLVVCYLPFGIAVALTPQRGMPLSSYLARNFAVTIVYLNSSLNPLLYCWRIREVRQAVKETLRQLFCWSSWSSMHSTILDKSPWDSTPIFIFFCHFSVPSIKQCIIFEIFLQFSLPPPYTKLKLGKNSGYTRSTLFVRWGEGFDLYELENAPERQKCPKTFVHDCSC